MSCCSCPRHCASRASGFCGVGEELIVGRIAPHRWEEPVISGTKGSGTVFFSGCSLKCVYCQNAAVSAGLIGKHITASELDARICALLRAGVHNINFVTPTHYAQFLADFLKTHRYPVPIVYNCAGYEDIDALEALRGKVDIFLPDFKYADNTLAKRYSSVSDYVETAQKALEKMYALVGDAVFDAQGLMQKGVLVRHLVLPGHVENSLDVIDRFDAFAKGKRILFSLMSQYTPCGDLQQFPALQRRVSDAEYTRVLNYLSLLGIDGFCQDLQSAQEIYIPAFSADLEV